MVAAPAVVVEPGQLEDVDTALKLQLVPEGHEVGEGGGLAAAVPVDHEDGGLAAAAAQTQGLLVHLVQGSHRARGDGGEAYVLLTQDK